MDELSYEGQLVGYNPSSGMHHILYRDGEDEWINLAQERVEWLERADRPIPAGLEAG